ncbi:MAG TPA: iron-sulfur cluster assembly scaffold protein [Planctomycetota bacterium]|nr:iron-sulfur cluster assembly scaffold protein [Planctomycetota bacterium]
MLDYSEKVVDHFLHPRHLGVLTDGDVKSPGERLVIADVGHITRGDALRLCLRIRVEDEMILDARFQNFGTGMPIASASYLCSQIITKPLSDALKISAEDMDRALEGLPELKRRQPVLILDALDTAARKFRGQPPRERSQPGEAPLCTCFQVSESLIERAVRLRGLKSIDEITAATRAGGGCHTCHPELEEILERCAKGEYRHYIPPDDYDAARRLYGSPPPSPEELARNEKLKPPERSARTAPDGFVYPDQSPVAAIVSQKTARRRKVDPRPWKELTYVERLQRIEDTLEYDLRPAIRTDGGDIRLLDLKDNRVLVSLHGHCKNCHSATSTLKMGVEKRLQEAVWPELEIEEVFEPL